MAQVLLFNIRGEKRRKIRFLLMKLGIVCREIPAEDFGRPLGALAGREGFDAPAEEAGTFIAEMLVMDGLDPARFNGLLDGLRRTRAPVALKAVVTEQNLRWSPMRLQRELAAEHEAMRRGDRDGVHKS